ncbi:hypothetical protein ACIQY8_17475 [Streptomyces albidoflavus]
MDKQRYDQRVRVFVEVRGGEADRELAGERFAAHGWPVREAAPAGEGPLGEAVEARPDSRVCEIEVWLPGIAKGAGLGAARRVAKALRVEGYVRRADVLHRDREMPSYWRAVDTRSRPRPAGAGPGRLLYRAGLALGLADGRTLVHAEGRQALRLARAGLGAGALVTGVRGPGCSAPCAPGLIFAAVPVPAGADSLTAPAPGRRPRTGRGVAARGAAAAPAGWLRRRGP